MSSINRPLIFVFPGQASQFVGMGRDLYDNSPAAAKLMDFAMTLPGMQGIRDIAFDGPEELLTRTDNVQPAITIVSMMAYAALMEAAESSGLAIAPAACAGHSLGEYAAHCAAGNLDFSTTLQLVQKRGYWMNEASQPPNPKGGMIAVMGLPFEKLSEIVEQIGPDDIALANINSPGQFILSGAASAVEAATAALQAAGAKRVIPLNVSGAWHSPLMRTAQAKMRELIASTLTDKLVQSPFATAVVVNATSDVVTSAEQLRTTLGDQIALPVVWTKCVRKLFTETGFPNLPSELPQEQVAEINWPLVVEVGPGKVLRGLIKAIDKGIETAGVEDTTTVKELVERLLQ